MAENESGQDKKHQPTDRKRRQASEKGQIAKSQDLNALAVLAAGGVALIGGGAAIGGPIIRSSTALWLFDNSRVFTLEDAKGLGADALWTIVLALALPLGAVALAALVSSLAQSKMQLAPKALEPKLDKLNPLSGFKQTFMSWTPLVELGKGVGKLGLLGGVVAWGISDRAAELPQLAALDARAFMNELLDLSATVLFLSLPVILVIAAADYAYSAWKTSNDLKMTDQEVKEHQKDQDGDPKWKGFRRQRQRQIAMGTMIQALREADVVVTNPTHFAVALRYQRDRDAAPVVVAKGVDHMALHIRRLAKDAGIPRIEDRPLARALHAQVPVGHHIPEDLYGPVARVLAVIYKKRKRAS